MKLWKKTIEWMKGMLFTFIILSALGIVWSLTTITDTSVITDSINVTGNVTAAYFIGDGSRLTSIASNGTGDITAVNTHGSYVYGGATLGNADIYFNETQLNSTIDARNNGTSSTSLSCSNITGAASDLCTITQFSGNYTDLTGNPTALSNFTNDLGYLTTESDPTIGTQVNGRLCTSNGTHINCATNASNATEIDPFFSSSVVSTINSTNISRWNTAYAWGNHALVGYLTTFTELDPVFLASAAHNILAANITAWNNAVTWGNHALAGYLKANTTNNATKWNTAYAWGNHSKAGYIKNYTETDPQIGATTLGNMCTGNGSAINCATTIPVDTNCSSTGSCPQITYDTETTNWDKNASNDFNGTYSALTGKPTHLSNFTNDMGYIKANATNNITKWNTAYAWGNHATAGYLTTASTLNASKLTNTATLNNKILSKWANITDHPTNLSQFTNNRGYINNTALTGYLKANSTNNATKWNLAYAWGNHSLAGYLTSFTELDPVYLASAAHTILAANITAWNNAVTWGNHALAGYLKANATNNATKWNTAYAYGNHSKAGYLKANTTNNATKWNTAYNWGNHAIAGYLTTASTLNASKLTNTATLNNKILSKWANITDHPTNLSQFTNDRGYINTSALAGYLKANATNNATKWNTAYAYGNHSKAGYLKANTTNNATKWNLAYGWGNHALAGYLTTFNELDPVFLASAAHSILAANITAWNNAVTWGNHALAGYLKANTTNNATKWNTAYAYGNHSKAGYLKSYTETDPQIGAVTNTKWCAANGTAVNCNNSAPVLAEVDPIVNVKTSGKYCMYSASKINCNITAILNTTISGAPSANQVTVFSSPTSITGSSTLNINNSKVGIGTSAPTQALDVRGNITTTGFLQQNRGAYVEYFNEFTGDAVDTYPITLGTQSIQFTSMKFGTYRWISGAVAGNDAGIGLGYTTTTTGANYNVTYSYLDMSLMMANTAGYRMFIGYLKTSASADMTTINAATVFFTNTSYGGAYWYAMCCNAAGAANCQVVNTTVARDTSFHRYTINTQDTYAEFYIDGTLRANITTVNKYPRNVGYSWVGTYQETTDVNADNHQLDYIYFRAKRR